MPSCLLGSMQLVNAAKLISRMDQVHGLVERILLETPLAFCPTLTEMEEATDQLSTEVVSDFSELFENINGTLNSYLTMKGRSNSERKWTSSWLRSMKPSEMGKCHPNQRHQNLSRE